MRTLPRISAENKFMMIMVGCSIFALFYVGTGILSLPNAHSAPILSWDRLIPFMPWTIMIYCSQFIFLLLAVIQAPNTNIATRTYYSYLLATLLACCVYHLYPIKLERIELNQFDMHPLFYYFYQFLYWSDTPNNCLPSLHTAFALLAANSLRQRHNSWQIIAPLWSVAIIGSTLTTKQHCIVDVLAGVILFFTCAWITQHYFISKRQNELVVFQHYPHKTVKS